MPFTFDKLVLFALSSSILARTCAALAAQHQLLRPHEEAGAAIVELVEQRTSQQRRLLQHEEEEQEQQQHQHLRHHQEHKEQRHHQHYQDAADSAALGGFDLSGSFDAASGTVVASDVAPAQSAVVDRPTEPSMFVFVFSRREDVARRALVREMWRSAKAGPGSLNYRFALCHDNDAAQQLLRDEYVAHKDLVLMACEEGYTEGRLTRKVLAAMRVYMENFSNYGLFMKVDDDAFVAWPRLAKTLVDLQRQGAADLTNAYMGVPIGETHVCRNASFLWYEPYENWPQEKFPGGMAGGSGYVLGKSLLRTILRTGIGDSMVLYNEDRAVAAWVQKLEKVSSHSVKRVAIPGIDGWWNWNYEHPTDNWRTWGDYQHVLHHGLRGETIACLGVAAAADDPGREVGSCFAQEAGQPKHAPLVCAKMPGHV